MVWIDSGMVIDNDDEDESEEGERRNYVLGSRHDAGNENEPDEWRRKLYYHGCSDSKRKEMQSEEREEEDRTMVEAKKVQLSCARKI